jgi:hypothetical protein
MAIPHLMAISRTLYSAAGVILLGFFTAGASPAQTKGDNRAPQLLQRPVPQPRTAKLPIIAKPAASPAAELGKLPPANGLPQPQDALDNAGGLPETFTPSDEFQQWITTLAREHLPDKYEKAKNWGRTTKVWDGLKLTTDDGRLSTKRRWKQANDGTWYKYRVDIIEPEKHFDIRIENIHEIPGGKISADVQVLAKLKCFGRMSQWEHGVQLVSLSADAETLAIVTAQVELAMRLDLSHLPPDVLLVPEVRSARVDIRDFKLHRVSNAHGPLVKSLSASAREVVEDKLEEQNRGKLAEKMNKQIAKQSDKLRMGLPDVTNSPWAALLPKQTASP